MKKLIVNGCSFVAGDAIVWEKYIEEYNRPNSSWFSFISVDASNDKKEFLKYYYEYRKKYNFPSMLAKELNCDVIDLSRDGNSNDMIALETISYILSIPIEERKNYHVLVGWTNTSRIIKYSKISTNWHNIYVKMIDLISKFPIANEFKFTILGLIKSYDEDYLLNFLKNVLLLENFLQNNQCTYTFYKNLVETFTTDIKNFNLTTSSNFTNENNWYKFISNTSGFQGPSFRDVYLEKFPLNKISIYNPHPNLKIMTEFTNEISNFIRENKLL